MKSPVMRVKRTTSRVINVDDRDIRFIPAGMKGNVLDVDGDGMLLVSWDYAFAVFPDDVHGAEAMVIERCEEEGVPSSRVEFESISS